MRYCEAVTRAMFEASSWAGANAGCARKAVAQGDDGGWYCRLHLDPDKRYGINHNRKKAQDAKA